MVAQTRNLGRDGPIVSSIGIGLMGMSAFYGPPVPDEQTFETLDKAIEEGCTFWDTSDFYGDNSERLQRYFAARPGAREKVFLCTKVSNFWKPDGSVGYNGDPEYLREAGHKVLQRLGLPSVDMLYLHRADRTIPIEKSVAAVAEFVKAGKAKYLAISEVSAASIRRAHAVHPISAVQLEYSATTLDIEKNGVLETCRELGIAIVAYSPTDRGILTGTIKSRADLRDLKSDGRHALPRLDDENLPNNMKVLEKFDALAHARGITPAQLALAWLLAQGNDIIPIPGMTKASRVVDNMGAIKVNLSAEDEKEVRSILSKFTGRRFPEYFVDEDLFVDTPPL